MLILLRTFPVAVTERFTWKSLPARMYSALDTRAVRSVQIKIAGCTWD